jgi:hypothetical protein
LDNKIDNNDYNENNGDDHSKVTLNKSTSNNSTVNIIIINNNNNNNNCSNIINNNSSNIINNNNNTNSNNNFAINNLVNVLYTNSENDLKIEKQRKKEDNKKKEVADILLDVQNNESTTIVKKRRYNKKESLEYEDEFENKFNGNTCITCGHYLTLKSKLVLKLINNGTFLNYEDFYIYHHYKKICTVDPSEYATSNQRFVRWCACDICVHKGEIAGIKKPMKMKMNPSEI